MRGTPMAEANFAAPSKIAVAKLRSREGNQRPMALALEGKVGASPTPRRKRAAEEAAYGGGDGSGEGGDAPEKDADAADAFDSQLVEQDADGKLAHGVGPVVGAGQIAEGDRGDSEGRDEGGV